MTEPKETGESPLVIHQLPHPERMAAEFASRSFTKLEQAIRDAGLVPERFIDYSYVHPNEGHAGLMVDGRGVALDLDYRSEVGGAGKEYNNGYFLGRIDTATKSRHDHSEAPAYEYLKEEPGLPNGEPATLAQAVEFLKTGVYRSIWHP